MYSVNRSVMAGPSARVDRLCQLVPPDVDSVNPFDIFVDRNADLWKHFKQCQHNEDGRSPCCSLKSLEDETPDLSSMST
jgi:hypothetical protein